MPKEKPEGWISETFPGAEKKDHASKSQRRDKNRSHTNERTVGSKGSRTSMPPEQVYRYRELANEDDSFFYDDDIGETELDWDSRLLQKPVPLKGRPGRIYRNKSIATRHLSSPSVHMKKNKQ